MNALAVLTLIEGLIQAGISASEAWTTVSRVVSEKRDPTAEEWAIAGLEADDAHIAVMRT